MREIKFRAWDAYRKRIYEVIEINWLGESIKVYADFAGYGYTNMKSAILMQYTGLHDEGGKEIYEGDIVYLAGYGDHEVEWPFIQLYESSWENDIGEIKGNIYENPELLELGPPHEKED
jgi:uncharacterized phage protein (TIGR01671 family)